MPTTHTTIQEAMAAVHEALPAIGKHSQAPAKMGGFMFRGIDAVLDALNPILAEHGVFYTPHVNARLDAKNLTSGGTTMRTVVLRVKYVFHHRGGTDTVDAEVYGEGDDTSDKATAKALTGAQKSMLFQVFAINTEEQAGSDPDHGTVGGAQGNGANQPTTDPELKDGWATMAQQNKAHTELYAEIAKCEPEVKAEMKAFMADNHFATNMTRIQYDATAAKFIELTTTTQEQPV